MTSVVVLAPYPISRAFQHRLEEQFGDGVLYLNLAALRRLPMFTLLRTLRGYRGAGFVLAFEDPSSRAVLPILQAIAAIAGAANVTEITADRTPSAVSSRSLAPALATFAEATADGFATLARYTYRLDHLKRQTRQSVTGPGVGRILYLNPNLWFGIKAGGSVAHLAGVVNGFLAHGVGVELFSPAEPILVDDAATFHILPPPSTFGLPMEINYPRFQRTAVGIPARHASAKLDFVYQRLSVETFAGVELARRLRLPLVLEYNGSEVWAARHWGTSLRFERYARAAEEVSLRHAHLVVTVSDVLRSELLERGIPEDRIVMYPNCVDERIYDPHRFSESDRHALRSSFGIDEEAVVATFIGTFGRWHGVDVLAGAIARMVDTNVDWVRSHRLHFLLVGDGLRMPEVREVLDDDRVAPFVTLTGLLPQERGAAVLAASDILLSPHVPNPDGSPFFGSPTKLFEYMAMGKGIVASSLDQIAVVLAPGLSTDSLPSGPPDPDEHRLAVLVPPADEDGIIRGVRFLVEQPVWRETLGRNARREALSRYTWRHHVQAILERTFALGLVPGSTP